jgi:hypothetical protein
MHMVNRQDQDLPKATTNSDKINTINTPTRRRFIELNELESGRRGTGLQPIVDSDSGGTNQEN